jgi:hypothetical protein
MSAGFERIRKGMAMDDVRSILGPPDRERPLPFGQEELTTWVYHQEGKEFCIYFDESGKVRITSDT